MRACSKAPKGISRTHPFARRTFYASSSAKNIQLITKQSLPSMTHPLQYRSRRCVMKTQRSFARGWELYAASALLAAAVVTSLVVRAPRAAHAQGQERTHVASASPAPSATPEAPKPVKID